MKRWFIRSDATQTSMVASSLHLSDWKQLKTTQFSFLDANKTIHTVRSTDTDINNNEKIYNFNSFFYLILLEGFFSFTNSKACRSNVGVSNNVVKVTDLIYIQFGKLFEKRMVLQSDVLSYE